MSPAQVIARALVFLYTTGRDVTQQWSPAAGKPSLLRGVQHGLRPGTYVDLSDPQWRTFRHALPLLCVAAVVSAALARLVSHLFAIYMSSSATLTFLTQHVAKNSLHVCVRVLSRRLTSSSASVSQARTWKWWSSRSSACFSCKVN